VSALSLARPRYDSSTRYELWGLSVGKSKVYVGNTEASKEAIVRWSNNVLRVKIPETARTGGVWVVINNKESDGKVVCFCMM
jgi:hypothetical protein